MDSFPAAAVVAESMTLADSAPMSKKQRKRLEKQKRREAGRQQFRAMEKERRKAARLKRRTTDTSAVLVNDGSVVGVVQNTHSGGIRRTSMMADSPCKQRVAIDCSYDHLMTEKEIKDLVGQLTRCYSSNRHHSTPLQLYMVGLGQPGGMKTKQRLDELEGTARWDVNFCQESLFSCFSKEDIVYLSSESPNILTNLDSTKVYIIGGLVDRNRYKGTSYKLATELGVAHAQLPIAQYIKTLTRKVLTTCHVFDIVLRVAANGGSGDTVWQEALLQVLPKRHGITPINTVREAEALSSASCSTAELEKPNN